MLAELSAGIADRDRLVNQLSLNLANDESHHTTVQVVAAVYFQQIQEATMALCKGNSHALRLIRRIVNRQQQVIRQQRYLLRRDNI